MLRKRLTDAGLLSVFAMMMALLCWTPSALAKGQTYHSEFYRYSVQVPEGWTTIDLASLPPEAIESTRRSMMNSPTDPQEIKMMESMEIDFMMRGPGMQPHTAAYAMIVGYDLEEMGVPADDADEFFRAAEQAMTQTFPTSKVDFRDGFPQLEQGEAAIDTGSMQFAMATETQQGETTHDGITWAKTGKTRHVMLVFMSASEYDASAAWATVLGSFELDADEVNHSAQASREYFEYGRKVGVNLRYVIVAVLVIGAAVLFWRRRQKQKIDSLAEEV